ncbi:acyltransferase [Clostridium sp.]|uniref:acyltransferase n=1 Tax=Clostridium sp. TaxID=1506 RepID=UPI0039ED8E43
MESKSKFIVLKGASISDYVNIKCYRNSELCIGENTFIGPFSIIHCRKSINIGNNCMIGEAVSIRDNDHKFREKNKNYNQQGFDIKKTAIGDNVWIGAKVTILSGVIIGDNSIIGANTLVNKDIPDNTIVGGVPVKIIKRI